MPSNYVDKNASEKYEVYLTSGGNATGGDKRIGNNYARIALDLFKEKVNKNDFTFLNSMLKDCGVPGKTDKERNVYAKSYYLLVEPLTAIYTQSWTNNAVAVGTTNDLRLMGILKNYSDYVYHYFMYINPVVFNTFKGGPLDSCSQSVQNDRNKIAGKGCVGAFTMYIGDIVKDNCSDNASKVVEDYFSNGELISGKNEQDYLKALYKDETVRNECSITKSGNKYYLNDKCNALDPISIKAFKGIGVSNACSKVSCTTQIDKAKTIYSGSALDEYAKELHDYWNNSSRGSSKKDYSYLTKTLYDLLNDGVPKCDDADFTCDPVKGTIKNCDANMTFKDNANPGCWAKGVAYNMATNPTNSSAYESSRDDYLSPNYGTKCDVYCIESVSFELPNDRAVNAYGTKAGKIFKWGTNTDVNNSLFGTMKVTRECTPIGTSCAKKNITPAYWITVGNGNNNYINTILSISYKEPVTNRVIDSANLKTSLVNFYINNAKKTSEKTVINTKEKFTVVANYRFDYGKELHWYSDKSQASKSVTEKSIKTTLPNPHYVEIGYGLPTDFTEPSNVYPSNWIDNKGFDWSSINKKTSGYMYATVKNVGTKNKDGSYHFDKLIRDNKLPGYNEDGSFNYSCDFSITNELFETECKDTDDDPLYCDHKQPPKGIDVVFRTIQLVNPTASDKNNELVKAFPGRSGSGREIGKNWSMWKDGNPHDANDKTNIYDILRNTVYDRKPLYKITLDSSTIMKIREYNKEARNTTYNSTGKVENVDPYTFMGEIEQSKSKNKGYSGYKCVKNNDSRFAYCASNFLSKLYEDKKLTGDCLISDDTGTRASNFSKKICG